MILSEVRILKVNSVSKVFLFLFMASLSHYDAERKRRREDGMREAQVSFMDKLMRIKAQPTLKTIDLKLTLDTFYSNSPS